MAESSMLQTASVTGEAQYEKRASGTTAVEQPISEASYTNIDFVEEIRGARLRTLWKASLAAVFVLLWILLVLSGAANATVADIIVPGTFIVASSLLTRRFLKYHRYEAATWSYALGLIITISVMYTITSDSDASFVPYLGILAIFVIGMLMSVPDTIILLVTSYVLMLGMPVVVRGEFVLTNSGAFALILMGVAALLVSQVSGELYGIAEWALDSYRRERRTATALHESRLELEKNLLKQKNLTLQLQDVNEALDEARRAAEIAKHWRGVFLANMSHELRTPLNAIIGFSDTMLNFPVMYDEVELPAEYRADLNQIHTSGNHLLHIINDILDLSKIDAGRLEIEIEPVELEPIFKGVLEQAVGLIGGKPIELRRNFSETLSDALGDSLRIRQVLINLYSNAAKFTKEGYIELGCHETDDSVIITVSDTGPGIEPDQMDTIFEAFKQAASGKKQQRQGAGLGLAISKELLGLMDGEIWVESEVDQGSTFFVKLPKYSSQAAQ